MDHMKLAIVLSCVGLLRAAYQRPPNDCPSPCTCSPFMGAKWAYCNSTGISSVPNGIPLDTQVLELSNNNFEHVPKGALDGLINLEEVYFSQNGFIEGDIEEGVFDLPKLTTIGLSSNGYTTVPKCLPKRLTTLYFLQNNVQVLSEGSFFSCPLLEYVDFSYNQLSTIEERAFDVLSNITTMYMPFNDLSENSFPPDVFVKNTKLQFVGLRFNRFKHLLTNMPPSIQHIDYVGNEIKTLPSYAFKSLPNIQTMEFWQGQVTTVEDNAFFGLKSVTILDFMQDKISSTITNQTFAGLTGLKTLYMDLNNVSQINAGAFDMMSSVTELWFSDNKLSMLVPEVLNEKLIPHLSELYINGNPWICDCNLRWLREKMDNATYVIQDPHLITCAGPSKVAGKAWDELKPEEFVCN